MTNENWRAIIGFEGFYEVSDLGAIRTLRRGGRLMSPGLVKGRKQITLTRGGVKSSLYVHVLVLEAFVGPRPQGTLGCHDDGNCLNNIPSNLYWGTPKQNAADKIRHGTAQVGDRSTRAKLSEKIVSCIRLSKEPLAVLSERYGVSLAAISRARSHNTWKCVAADNCVRPADRLGGAA